ncbi:MAG: hypothetical protein CVU11_11725 [Bacteroidetes bacterium HGW-Bacteroidetes-6]|jgi:polyhydroxybutyrate depolymerase|nr:MAG: hypothetical protein CVU11_11725 [Bacteroidetes bacterium HGW-Bacteroidetes-6]
MRTTLLTLFFASLFLCVHAQTTKTILHGGLTRQYKEYVPASYTGSNPVPLVICLHGLGDNMTNFSGIGMHLLADSAQFITLYPQAVSSPYGTAWNSGASIYGITLNGTIDDVGFISALIDTTSDLYNIDPTRVYVCGFSMGGFMANRLACQLGTRIAATASVAGTIGTSCNCNPFRPIPVAHFHGTADSTVYYTGNLYGNDAEALVDYWVQFDGTDIIPIHSALPDVASDGMTVDLYQYLNGNQGSEVYFYKVTNATHTWLMPVVNDISYTVEIWNFFKRFQHTTLSVDEQQMQQISIFPNPAANTIQVACGSEDGVLNIFDYSGRLLIEQNFTNGFSSLDVSGLLSGIYVLQLTTARTKASSRFVKE